MKRQRAWDFWAKYYDRLWVQRVSLRPTRALVCEKILELEGVEKTKEEGEETACLNILDMGCGTGQLYGDLAQALGKERFHYLGLDPSGAMLEQAVDKFPEASFFKTDVMGAAPDQAPFDMIVCSHSFPYYPDGEAALHKMTGLLKPGGRLLLSQGCTDTLYDAVVLKMTGLTTSTGHYRSSQEMRELGSSLFRELKTFRISESFFVPSLWLFLWVK